VCNPERGPDIVLTFPWTSGTNAFGVAGTDTTDTSGAAGLQTGAVSGHGGLSPWTVHDTFIAWGRDFKRGVTVATPASIVDLAPTILVLLRIRDHTARDGRVLQEALRGGSDPQRMPVETRVLKTRPQGRYQAAVQFSRVGRSRYSDKGWRLP
jgi:arylsulfatase A-like enzyme